MLLQLTFVRSLQQLFVFIVQNKHLQVQSIPKQCYLILKTESMTRTSQLLLPERRNNEVHPSGCQAAFD